MAMMAAMPMGDVVKDKEMMKQPKRKRIIIKFNGRVITALLSPTCSAYMSQSSQLPKIINTDPNDSTIGSSSIATTQINTHSDVSKRKIQETHQSLDLDPVVVVKKQRQMVVPNPNSRVQSSSSISVTTTSTDYISNESSQLPKMKMKMKTDPSESTTTHINTHFEVSKRNTTEIYTTTRQDYESKLQLSKRKLQQGYEASERAKKQRQIVFLTNNEKPIPKSRSSQAPRFKSKKMQRLYVNHKTRQF